MLRLLCILVLSVHTSASNSHGLSESNFSVMADMADVKIVVASGVGLSKEGTGDKEVQQQHAILIEALQAKLREPISEQQIHLWAIAKASSSGVWSQALSALASIPRSMSSSKGQGGEGHASCGFAALDLTSSRNSLTIENLHKIGSHSSLATSKSACVSLLLAIVASEHHVLDVRVKRSSKLLNDYVKGIVQTGVFQQSYPYHDAGLVGSDQTVGVGDSGVDDLHCFFVNDDGLTVPRSSVSNPTYDLSYRKVIQYVAYIDGVDTVSGHGTHVCGTIAGDISDVVTDFRGHAPGAKIAFFDMASDENGIYYPSLYDKVFPIAYQAGARLHSNSWGGGFNMYDSDCIDIDQFLYETDDFMIFFAAGNSGTEGYYSIGNPAIAKNSLAVAASETDSSVDTMAYFSSLGPTFDGRIKPDITAPGYFTTSAQAGLTSSDNCYVTSKAGTSMATPAVAGVAAMIRQYFQDSAFWASSCHSSYRQCGTFSPKGSTVKAAIVHSGESMRNYISNDGREPSADLLGTPNFYEGFGRVLLPNVLPHSGIADFDLYVEEFSLQEFQELKFKVVISDTSVPLKATIAWMDPPNSVISSKLLLHDVDLKLTDSAGKVLLYGNNIVGDDLNNVEQVLLDTPSASSYFVVVTSKALTESDSQSLSIVITSGGSGTVTKQSVASVLESDTYNALNCGADEVMATVEMMDRAGDGWEGNSYVVTDSTGDVVRTGTLLGTTADDIVKLESFCLGVGEKYTVEIEQSGDYASEIGLDFDLCSVHLSEYNAKSTISVNSAGDCNVCDGYLLEIVLFGSSYLSVYGWTEGTYYELQKADGSVVARGTLVTGIMDSHRVCVSDGVYSLALLGAPADDDVLDDPAAEQYYGVEEYEVGVSSCSDKFKPYSTAAAGENVVFEISGGSLCSDATALGKSKILALIVMGLILMLNI